MIYPSDPTILDILPTGSVPEEGRELVQREYYKIPIDINVGFPQFFVLFIDNESVQKNYRFYFDYNRLFGNYFVTLQVSDVTDPDNEIPIFSRKILENIEYHVGYTIILFTKINLTEKFFEGKTDPNAGLDGVLRYLE